MVELLYFGTYEQVLYPYVKHNLRAEDRVQNETAFVEHLLLAADEEGNTVSDITSSVASRYRTGVRAIPDNVVALFRKPGARDIVIDYLDDLVVPYVDRGRKHSLLKEFVDIVERDKTIDRDYKKVLIAEATPERLAAFLADLLIYAVGIDPTKQNEESPEENSELLRTVRIINVGEPDGLFLGRDELLKSLDNGFKEGYQIQLIGGGDGIGKSRLALEYAHRRASKYRIICWVNTWNEECVLSSIVGFLNKANVPISDYSADVLFELFRRFFEANTDWLIIFDNADLKLSLQQGKLKKLIPLENGNIIVTGNFGAENGFKDSKYHVLGLGEDLFDASMSQISSQCSGHPMPMTLAKAYIGSSTWMTPEIYLHMLEDRGIRAEKSAPSDIAEAAFEIQMRRIENRQRYFSDRICAAAKQFLVISAICNQMDIDLNFLSGAFPILPDPLRAVCEDKETRKRLVDELKGFGFYEISDGVLHGNTWLYSAAHGFFSLVEQDNMCALLLGRTKKNVDAVKENAYSDNKEALLTIARPYVYRALYYAHNYGNMTAEQINGLFPEM